MVTQGKKAAFSGVSSPAGEGHSTDLLVDSASGPHDGATERQLEPVRNIKAKSGVWWFTNQLIKA